MNILDIAKKAQEEGMVCKEDILSWLKERRKTLLWGNRRAIDVKVPASYLYAIEKIADNVGIPCHYICNSTFSIALTYSDLLRHEKQR